MNNEFSTVWREFTEFRNKQSKLISFTDQRSKFILSYWARINALCDEIFVLINNDCFVSPQILMRSVLESFVELRCLINDEAYVEKVFSAQSNSEYLHLKDYSEANPFYKGTEPISSEELKELKVNQNLTIKAKFKKAGCEELYSTIYNHLCRLTHGNISALASKNFEKDKVVISKKIKNSELRFILSSTINVAVSSTELLFTFYKVDEKNIEMCSEFIQKVKVLCNEFV